MKSAHRFQSLISSHLEPQRYVARTITQKERDSPDITIIGKRFATSTHFTLASRLGVKKKKEEKRV